jgi:hypothetical protein
MNSMSLIHIVITMLGRFGLKSSHSLPVLLVAVSCFDYLMGDNKPISGLVSGTCNLPLSVETSCSACMDFSSKNSIFSYSKISSFTLRSGRADPNVPSKNYITAHRRR